MMLSKFITNAIYFYIKLFGLLPFSYNKCQNRYYKSKLNYCYSACVLGTLVCCYPYSALQLILDYRIHDPLTIIISLSEYFISYFAFIRVVHNIVFRSEKLLNLLNRFFRMTTASNRLKFVNENRRLLKIGISLLVKVFLSPVIYIAYTKLSFDETLKLNLIINVNCVLCYVILVLASLLVLNIFYVGLVTVDFHANKIGKQLEKIILTINKRRRRVDVKSCDQLNKLVNRYGELVEISNDLNNMFNSQILAHFVNNFVCIVAQFFYLVSMVAEFNRHHYVISKPWFTMTVLVILYYFLEFVYIADISESIRLNCLKLKLSLNEITKIDIDVRLQKTVSF